MSRPDQAALRFTRLTVRRLPGIRDGGFTLDTLASGINIIHGPNASGKTTTARAIASLLWPRAAAPPDTSLDGHFELAGAAWAVAVDGGGVGYQREGVEANAPLLPPAESRHRYHLSLHELLVSENRDLADEIARESAGGYDIAAAGASIHTRTAATKWGPEARDLEEARARLHRAREEQARLQQREQRLQELELAASAAEAAGPRLRLLERALEHAAAVAEEEEARAALESFPAALARMNGAEAAHLASIRKRLHESGTQLERAVSDQGEATAQLEEAGLRSEALEDPLLPRLRAEFDRLRSLAQVVEAKERELEGARAARAESWRRIGAAVDEARVGALDIVALDELADFAEEAGKNQAARTALEARHNALGGGDARIDRDQVTRGVWFLRQWLRVGGGGAEGGGADWVRNLLGVAAAFLAATALLLAGAGVVAGLRAIGVWSPGALGTTLSFGSGADTAGWAGPILRSFFLTLFVLLLLFLLRRPGGSGASNTASREARRREYENLGLAAPRDWTPEGVGECLDRLETSLAEARLVEARTGEQRVIEGELLRVEAEWATLDARRKELASALGIVPPVDATMLYSAADRIGRWQDAASRVVQLTAELTEARRQYAEVLTGAAARLTGFGYEITDLAGFAGGIESLAARLELHRRGLDAQSHALKMSERAREVIRAAEGERHEILVRLGVWPPAEGGAAPDQSTRFRLDAGGAELEALVEEWSAQYPAYRTALDRLLGSERVRRAAYGHLSRTPGFEAGIEDWSIDDLQNERAEAERRLTEEGALREEITEIRTLIDSARESHNVEAALAELERCEARLQELHDRDILGVVGRVLLDHLQRTTRDQHRPEVFRRARALFSRITHGQYRLEFDDGEAPAFRAYDEITGEGKSLDQLSSGTRIQLLLAVRLAFVESQESGIRLPLIFDETLGNSDDARAEAIMEATVALAGEGRQIFYFTAQSDEVGKWRGMLARHPDVAAAVIDLAAARQLARYEASPALEVVSHPVLMPSAPNGASRAEYGALLQVPAIDPDSDIGGVHLWHLVEEPELLYQFLCRNIESWGALRSLIEYGGAALLGEAAGSFMEIEAAARALELAIELVRIGRGKRVDRAALEESGVLSDRFQEQVIALAAELEGDAERLMQALEEQSIPHFRSGSREALRDYLERESYLDPREPVEFTEIRIQVLAALAREIDAGWLTVALVDRILASLLDKLPLKSLT